ncbi:MAG: TatD family deoxyribonuclease [Alphaproteobacteria bacterium]|nr:TatD family deoxyribonuclease [Alphaproteobacteria bacterium]
MSRYFDAHVHLQMISDLNTVMNDAQRKNVSHFICNSTSPADWQQVLQISKNYSNVCVCFGVHPHYVQGLPKSWFVELEKILLENPHSMMGEIGLDKLKPDLDLQEEVLRKQLTLAWKLNRSAHIHCVRAWDRLLHVFKSQREKMPPKLLMHSHHGNADLIPVLIEKYNAYFSYSAIFVPENRPKIRACMNATPLNRILIESDAPDLTAQPSDIVDLTKKMSVITGHNLNVLKKALFKNAQEFVNGN